MKIPKVYPLNDLPSNFHLGFNLTHNNASKINIPNKKLLFKKHPISLEEYNIGFEIVKNNLAYGNSFLTNYTCSTPIETNFNLTELYAITSAKYKLLIDNKLLIFSPETFVKIENGKIKSFPMKGTIDASIPNAEDIILNDEKELAEHYTIVDLIRNDLSRVSKKVHVPRFRYIDRIKNNAKELIQISSEVEGTLPENHLDQLGDLFAKLLPAGSISGAPKKRTVEIIQQAERQKRGYYTGVFGIFDGENLDSGVAIRFIEQKDNQLFYRSGGGITHQSLLQSEYQEMIDKVYVPINREYQGLQREGLQHSLSQPAL